MVVPDTIFISEIILYSMGFKAASQLAKKITQTFKLISEQLKGHKHYDFGLRTIKTCLLNAGKLKLKALSVDFTAKVKMETANNRLKDYLESVAKMKISRKRGALIAKSAVKRQNVLKKI